MESHFKIDLNLCKLYSRQLVVILTAFLAIGLIIGTKIEERIPVIIMMLGFFIYSIGFILAQESILFTIHDLHCNLRKLRRAAEDLKDRDDGRTIKELVRDIEDLEPISGYGLFTVDRTTLTSTISVMITYLIVLIQFKSS